MIRNTTARKLDSNRALSSLNGHQWEYGRIQRSFQFGGFKERSDICQEHHVVLRRHHGLGALRLSYSIGWPNEIESCSFDPNFFETFERMWNEQRKKHPDNSPNSMVKRVFFAYQRVIINGQPVTVAANQSTGWLNTKKFFPIDRSELSFDACCSLISNKWPLVSALKQTAEQLNRSALPTRSAQESDEDFSCVRWLWDF